MTTDAARTETALPRTVTDRTGARLVLRPIRPDDWQAVQAGYESWSPEQKRMRMLDTIAHLTEGMARSVATVEDPCHEILLVLAPEETPHELLAGARLVWDSGHEDRAEFSVSVRADCQGRGLGGIVLAETLAEGKARGLSRVWGLISRRNDPMLSLARRLGFEVRTFPDDWSLMLAEKAL